jgi:hypothetical protein
MGLKIDNLLAVARAEESWPLGGASNKPNTNITVLVGLGR